MGGQIGVLDVTVLDFAGNGRKRVGMGWGCFFGWFPRYSSSVPCLGMLFSCCFIVCASSFFVEYISYRFKEKKMMCNSICLQLFSNGFTWVLIELGIWVSVQRRGSKSHSKYGMKWASYSSVDDNVKWVSGVKKGMVEWEME